MGACCSMGPKAWSPAGSLLQHEFLAQLVGDFVGKLLRIGGVFRRGDHHRPPAEQRISAYRDIDAADNDALGDHFLEFGFGLFFFSHNRLPVLLCDSYRLIGAAFRRRSSQE